MGRAALDYHHLRGDLAISWRDGTMAAYFDLAERVLPRAWLHAPVPEEEDAQRMLLRRAMAAVGVGTVGDLADHHRQHAPTARRLLSAMAADGEVVEVEVDRWRGPVYADPDLVIPRSMPAATLVNPFDPVMWNRSRVKRLFDLDYRVEIYTPADQRRFGYYVLPFLLGEHLVALLDLKHDRQARLLRVQAAHLHPHPPDAHPTTAEIVAALAGELHQWARWVVADDVAVADNGGLAAELARSLAGRGSRPADVG